MALLGGQLPAGRLQLFYQTPALLALHDDRVDPEGEEDPEEDRERPYKSPDGPRLRRQHDAPHYQQRRQEYGGRDGPAHRKEAVELGVHDEEEEIVDRVDPDQGDAKGDGAGRVDEHLEVTLDPAPMPDDHEPVPEAEDD